TVEGSTGAIDALKATLGGSVTLAPGRGVPPEPGEHVLALRDTLRAHPALDRRGVTLAEVKPEALRVTVEQLESRSVPVRVVAPQAPLRAPPDPSPARVTLTGPRDALSRLDPAALTAVARIDAAVLNALPEGQRTTINKVRLEPPEALRGLEAVTVE